MKTLALLALLALIVFAPMAHAQEGQYCEGGGGCCPDGGEVRWLPDWVLVSMVMPDGTVDWWYLQDYYCYMDDLEASTLPENVKSNYDKQGKHQQMTRPVPSLWASSDVPVNEPEEHQKPVEIAQGRHSLSMRRLD